MGTAAATRRSVSFVHDQPFFLRSAILIAVVTVASFVQLIIRGYTDPRSEPIWVHLHAALMVSWLALFIAQNVFATRDVAVHRVLGRVGIILALAVPPVGWFTVVRVFQLHRSLPGYDDAWFLMQTLIEVPAFVALVFWGVAMRRDPQFHRRLMFGATVIVAINPALSRVIPLSIGGDPSSGWLIFALELFLLVALLRHDRRVLGAAHPGSISVGAMILGCQALMIVGSYSPAVRFMAHQLSQS